MGQLEQALAALETSVSEAQKKSDELNKSFRKLRGAIKAGNIQQIERGLTQLPEAAEAALSVARGLGEAWAFDVRAYLETGYAEELRRLAGDVGLELFERDGRIYAFPLMLKVLPGELALRIANRTERDIRPSELVRRLVALQKRAQRFSEQRFLDLLYKTYQKLAGMDWKRVSSGNGPAIVLLEIHEVLTLLPGADYPVEEFGRDLLLLDRQPHLKTRDGAGFHFGGATLTRVKKPVVVFDETGQLREYTAVTFAREG